jgi:hypothetical protein
MMKKMKLGKKKRNYGDIAFNYTHPRAVGDDAAEVRRLQPRRGAA